MTNKSIFTFTLRHHLWYYFYVFGYAFYTHFFSLLSIPFHFHLFVSFYYVQRSKVQFDIYFTDNFMYVL